ncbi:MAG: energy transducer TonB [Rhodanobacteraceae bacterium]
MNRGGSTGAADRLGVTLLFSVIAHAVLALGLTFEFEKPAPTLPSLDVILVHSANSTAPKNADFLAQANNSGGGESLKAKRPSAPVSGLIPEPTEGLSPLPMTASNPAPKPPAALERLTQEKSDFSVARVTETTDPSDLPVPSTREEIDRKLEMARLAEEIRRDSERYAKRPKRKYISANTKEYAYASYMREWVARIERLGNLNYPDEARRRQLHGELVLTVGLDRNGDIKSVDIIKSSRHKVLDDAAIRIVHLAAPFPPIPRTTDNLDELYITRTWQFLPGDILRNR